MAKRKTKKRAKRQARPVLSTGNALKQIREDCLTLALGICGALEKKGAVRGKRGMILSEDLIMELKLQEGDHFQHVGKTCLMLPLQIHPVALVRLARDLQLTRQSADQKEGTYIPLQTTAWIQVYPELL
jgi:hypothetical protein